MKKICIAVLLVSGVFSASAQYESKDKEEEKTHGFKKENLFTGGSIMASFYTGGTALGISPYFGYSINRFIDVAASVNVNYNSERDYYAVGDKLRQTTYGPGAFVRLYPVRFLFAQGSYEHNFIKLKYIPANNSNYLLTTTKQDANSTLVGGGYCSGREGTGSIFYYFSVMWDVSRVAESPYVDGLGRNYPIFRAGLQIPLFQGGDSHRYGRRKW